VQKEKEKICGISNTSILLEEKKGGGGGGGRGVCNVKLYPYYYHWGKRKKERRRQRRGILEGKRVEEKKEKGRSRWSCFFSCLTCQKRGKEG